MKSDFGKMGLLASSLALAALLINGAATWWSLGKLVDHDAWVAHTHEVLAELNHLGTVLASAEGARPVTAPPSDAEWRRCQEALTHLKQLTTDNAAQQMRLDRLENLLTEAQAGLPPIPWEPMRQLIAEMTFEEHCLLQERDREARRTAWVAYFAHAVRSGVAVLVLGLIVFLAWRYERQRQRIVGALRESENRFRQLADAMPQIVWTSDAQGGNTYLNRQWRDYTGLDGAAAAELQQVVHPDDLALLHSRFEEAHSTGAVYQAEFRLRRTGETAYRWFLARATPARDAQGAILGWYGTSTDIDDQKRAERKIVLINEELEKRVLIRTRELAAANAELRQEMAVRTQAERALQKAKEAAEDSQRRTRLVVDSAFNAYVAIDAAGVIIDWNPQAEKTFGWSREQILGRRLEETIIPPAYRSAHLRGMQHFLASGGGPVLQRRVELSALRRDGSEFPVELTISPLRLGGEWVFSAFLHDISARKRTEAEVRQAKEAAEAANRAKSEFLANMSHEIRTPMNGILGMTDLVLDTDLSAPQREYLQMVKGSGEALLNIINDILDFSKIEAGKLVFEAAPFRLRAWMDETLKPLAVRAANKSLALPFRVASDVPDVLMGDQGRLRQVLVNLVGNALKFTERGEVRVGVTTTPFTAEKAEGADKEIPNGAEETCQPVAPSLLLSSAVKPSSCLLHFEVADTGIGIPTEKLESVFAPFVQADISTTRNYGGTGLGLAICTRLVEQMGGRIWAESQPGRGSVFHFTVCLQTPGQAGPTTPHGGDRIRSDGAEERQGGRRLRILLAEDNAVNQRLGQATLEKHGHTVVMAGNGREALAALEGNSFDVVLMDVQMPEMDGFEATAAVRRREAGAGRRLPIIALTAYAMKGDRQRCLDAGMDAYLSKPLQPRELLRAIEDVLSTEREDGWRSADRLETCPTTP